MQRVPEQLSCFVLIKCCAFLLDLFASFGLQSYQKLSANTCNLAALST